MWSKNGRQSPNGHLQRVEASCILKSYDCASEATMLLLLLLLIGHK